MIWYNLIIEINLITKFNIFDSRLRYQRSTHSMLMGLNIFHDIFMLILIYLKVFMRITIFG